jgi:hypothetical protein
VKGSSSPFLSLWCCIRRSLSFSCRRFTSSTPPGAPTPSAGAPPRVDRRRRSLPPQLLPCRQACFLHLWVVSITYPPFLDLHAHRSTGARTPARPAPPPFGVDRRDRWGRRLFGLVTCAIAPATHRTRSWSSWCPVARSRAAPVSPPPRAAALRRTRRRAPLAHFPGRWIWHGRS